MTKTEIMADVDQNTITRSKFIANNTVKYTLKDGTQIIRLYKTDIITFHTDGMIELNTGGYYTRTTKDRLNRFQPFNIHQKNYVWYVESENLPFYDGIKLNHVIVYGAVKSDANPDKRKIV